MFPSFSLSFVKFTIYYNDIGEVRKQGFTGFKIYILALFRRAVKHLWTISTCLFHKNVHLYSLFFISTFLYNKVHYFRRKRMQSKKRDREKQKERQRQIGRERDRDRDKYKFILLHPALRLISTNFFRG